MAKGHRRWFTLTATARTTSGAPDQTGRSVLDALFARSGVVEAARRLRASRTLRSSADAGGCDSGVSVCPQIRRHLPMFTLTVQRTAVNVPGDDRGLCVIATDRSSREQIVGARARSERSNIHYSVTSTRESKCAIRIEERLKSQFVINPSFTVRVHFCHPFLRWAEVRRSQRCH